MLIDMSYRCVLGGYSGGARGMNAQSLIQACLVTAPSVGGYMQVVGFHVDVKDVKEERPDWCVQDLLLDSDNRTSNRGLLPEKTFTLTGKGEAAEEAATKAIAETVAKEIKQRLNPLDHMRTEALSAPCHSPDAPCKTECAKKLQALLFSNPQSFLYNMHTACPTAGKIVGTFFVKGNPTVHVADDWFVTYRWNKRKGCLVPTDLCRIPNASQAFVLLVDDQRKLTYAGLDLKTAEVPTSTGKPAKKSAATSKKLSKASMKQFNLNADATMLEQRSVLDGFAAVSGEKGSDECGCGGTQKYGRSFLETVSEELLVLTVRDALSHKSARELADIGRLLDSFTAADREEHECKNTILKIKKLRSHLYKSKSKVEEEKKIREWLNQNHYRYNRHVALGLPLHVRTPCHAGPLTLFPPSDPKHYISPFCAAFQPRDSRKDGRTTRSGGFRGSQSARGTIDEGIGAWQYFSSVPAVTDAGFNKQILRNGIVEKRNS